jgi:hypothetical protein
VVDFFQNHSNGMSITLECVYFTGIVALFIVALEQFMHKLNPLHPAV